MKSGVAEIENGKIVIKIDLQHLPKILEGLFPNFIIENMNEYSKELIDILNKEDDDLGLSLIHQTIDIAIRNSVMFGSFGLKEIED